VRETSRSPRISVPLWRQGLKYRIELTSAAQRDLRNLDRPIRDKIAKERLKLGDDPRPASAERLNVKEKLYRLRVGPGKNYRAIYQVSDGILLVLVVRVGDRKEVYRGL
jgi:mRNA interferase RelE/StbE